MSVEFGSLGDLDEEDLPFDDDQFASIHSGEVVDDFCDPDHLFRKYAGVSDRAVCSS